MNVLALMSGNVPLVAIQLSALKIDDTVVLNFVRVLDQRQLRKDDVIDFELQTVDRGYWVQKSSDQSMRVADEVLAIINKTAQPAQQLNYVRHYVGLTDGVKSRNFIYFRPRRRFLRVLIPDGGNEERAARFDEAGLEAEQTADLLAFNISSADLSKHKDLISSIINEVVAEQRR